MRRASLSWFALCGAIGFGTGAALSELGSIFGDFSLFLFYLYVAIVGAVGGAALGLAMRDWKKTVLLAVAGSVAFGVGLGYIGEMVLYMSFLFTLQGLVGGAIGGAAFGLVLRGLRGAIVLGWGGAIGFAIGGGVADILGMVVMGMFARDGAASLEMIVMFLAPAVQGVVGGAMLGATLALFLNREPLGAPRPSSGMEPEVR